MRDLASRTCRNPKKRTAEQQQSQPTRPHSHLLGEQGSPDPHTRSLLASRVALRPFAAVLREEESLLEMFQVQRFTDEQQDDDGDDSTSILNRMLARAKARSSAKRARLGPDISDGVHQQTAEGVIPPAGGCSSKASEGEDDAAIMQTSGGEGLANGSTTDHRATPEDASEGTDDSSSSGEESSSSESGSEREEEDGDSSEAGADEEEPGEAAAIAGGRVDGELAVEAGGQQGLRPMEEVAEEWGLDPRLTEILRREGVKHFFPIQVMLQRVPITV